MKKILLAFDGTQFSEGAFSFARQLNDLHAILLTGVFMPQLSYANLWSYADGMAGPVYAPMSESLETAQIEENIKRFEEDCEKNNIAYSVHKDYSNFALPELRRETRFADLLIIGSQTFYNQVTEDASAYLQDALHDSECPVIVVPETCIFPKTNIIAYDGSASSVFAMKQFAYLFPELVAQETIVVYSGSPDEEDLPHQKEMEELAKQHFMDLNFERLESVTKEQFADWIGKRRGSILVTGSYGRSGFSQWLKKSFSKEVITDHQLPVFIAHK